MMRWLPIPVIAAVLTFGWWLLFYLPDNPDRGPLGGYRGSDPVGEVRAPLGPGASEPSTESGKYPQSGEGA